MQRRGLSAGFFIVVTFLVTKNEGRNEMTKSLYAHLMTTEGPIDPKVKDYTCLLAPETGPCRAHIKMFYFTKRDMLCRRFDWGGCQGNGNRFDTEEECMSTCVLSRTRPKQRPDYCTLSFDYGYCFGQFKRWHYNHRLHACQERVYSGCGGNKNSFDSKELCDSVCLFREGHIEVPWWKKSV